MNPAFEATATLNAPRLGMLGAVLFAWREMARPQKPTDEQVDRSTGFYNRAGLMAAAQDAVQARGGRVPVSVIVLEFSELREVHEIYGSAVTRKVVARLVRKIERMAGFRGLAGRTETAQFTVVLPGATRAKAVRALHRAFGSPARLEFDAGDSEIVLVPDVLVESLQPRAGTADSQQSVAGLHREMCRELARMQEGERRRRQYLAMERERHSRPMGLSAR